MVGDDLTMFAFCNHCGKETWHSVTISGRPRACLTCKKPADKAQRTLGDFA